MKKYVKAITNLNQLTLKNKNQDDIERYSESDIYWAANRDKPTKIRNIKKGTVYQFEFGKNYIPEMSYEHRGLVIGSSGQLLYVLPICSYDSKIEAHTKAYHPTRNPKSKGNYFLLLSEEFAFLKHDSVLKVNDIRTVSVRRIKYRQENGYIPPSSDTYKMIEKIVFQKYFHEYYYAYEQLQKENEQLRAQLSDTKA